MLISIVTGTYNSANTVLDTLKSVHGQTHPDREHIIIDGASQDNTVDLIRDFGKVDKIISEPDNGLYHAMNKGILNAGGEVIGILNSDDSFTSHNVLSQVCRAFQEDDHLMAVYGDLNYVKPDNPLKIVRKWKAGEYKHKRWLWGWMPPHPTFYVRKQVYEHFGLFNLDFRTSADYEIMLRFLYRYQIKVQYLPFTMVNMRTGGHSNATLNNRILANKEDRMAWEVNGLAKKPFTTYLKPIRKIPQYVFK